MPETDALMPAVQVEALRADFNHKRELRRELATAAAASAAVSMLHEVARQLKSAADDNDLARIKRGFEQDGVFSMALRAASAGGVVAGWVAEVDAARALTGQDFVSTAFAEQKRLVTLAQAGNLTDKVLTKAQSELHARCMARVAGMSAARMSEADQRLDAASANLRSWACETCGGQRAGSGSAQPCLQCQFQQQGGAAAD